MSLAALPIDTHRYDRDRELVDGLQRRDADAAERLVTTYQSRAYRLAVGITGNAEDAEEVVDDVLPAFDADGRHAAAVVDWSAAVDDPARHLEIRLALRSAIDELPPHHRAAVIMRDVQDWTCAEIGEVLGISVGGVKTRLYRARLFIRKRLAESLLGRSLGPPVGPRDQRGKRAW